MRTFVAGEKIWVQGHGVCRVTNQKCEQSLVHLESITRSGYRACVPYGRLTSGAVKWATIPTGDTVMEKVHVILRQNPSSKRPQDKVIAEQLTSFAPETWAGIIRDLRGVNTLTDILIKLKSTTEEFLIGYAMVAKDCHHAEAVTLLGFRTPSPTHTAPSAGAATQASSPADVQPGRVPAAGSAPPRITPAKMATVQVPREAAAPSRTPITAPAQQSVPNVVTPTVIKPTERVPAIISPPSSAVAPSKSASKPKNPAGRRLGRILMRLYRGVLALQAKNQQLQQQLAELQTRIELLECTKIKTQAKDDPSLSPAASRGRRDKDGFYVFGEK